MTDIEARERPFAHPIKSVAQEILGPEFRLNQIDETLFTFLKGYVNAGKKDKASRNILGDTDSDFNPFLLPFHLINRFYVDTEGSSRDIQKKTQTIAAAILFDKDIFKDLFTESQLRYFLDLALGFSILNFQHKFGTHDTNASYCEDPEEQIELRNAADHYSGLIDSYKRLKTKLRERAPEPTGTEIK